jgi:hypothetical protein
MVIGLFSGSREGKAIKMRISSNFNKENRRRTTDTDSDPNLAKIR